MSRVLGNVNRKNLPLIHLVSTEAPPRAYMFQAFHQRVEFLRSAALPSKLLQPRTEQGVERLMLRFGQQARPLDQLLICVEGDCSHT